MSADEEASDPGVNAKVKEVLFPSRKAPARATTQAEHVRDRKYGGNTAAMAAAYNVAPRTVRRWIDGTRKPTKYTGQLKREATEVQTTERGRERRAREMEKRASEGIASGVDATVSRVSTFEIRGSNATRSRDIPISLSSGQVARLARTMDEQEIEGIIAEGIAAYMNGGSAYGGFDAGDFNFNIGDVTFKSR